MKKAELKKIIREDILKMKGKRTHLKQLIREELRMLKEDKNDEFYLNIAVDRFKNFSGIKTLWDIRKVSGKYPTWETNLRHQIGSNGILSMLFSDITLVIRMLKNNSVSAQFDFTFEWKQQDGKVGTTYGGNVSVQKQNANRTIYTR